MTRRLLMLLIAGIYCLSMQGCKSGKISNQYVDNNDAGQDAGQQDAYSDAGDGLPDQASDPGQDASDPGSDGADQAQGFTCANPDPNWLLCEDFEQGNGNFDSWLAGSDFISGVGDDDRERVTLSLEQVHSGSWAIYMPAAASSGYRGGSLDWRACVGEQRSNCDMHSYERLHFRAWIRFAADHRYVHHFLNIGGSQPDDYWYHGTAGCLPNGVTSMGTTVDFSEDTHESHFYSYWPEMSCDTRCERYMDVEQVCQDCEDKGFPTCTEQNQCCWGNHFSADQPVYFPVGEWFCFEMMMQVNDIGQQNGVMAYWLNGELAHRVDENSPIPIWWRTSPTLTLNRVRLQHYITTEDAEGFSNRVWFDDVVVSTEYIGCE
ncbi:MAG: hypothetical protein JRJ87_26220 [Deltaproteobacteria bacterium]|nr:hypothetical protein [Deltaproteobacteria bacterium]